MKGTNERRGEERGRDLTERGSGEFAMEGEIIGLSRRTSPLGDVLIAALLL